MATGAGTPPRTRSGRRSRRNAARSSGSTSMATCTRLRRCAISGSQVEHAIVFADRWPTFLEIVRSSDSPAPLFDFVAGVADELIGSQADDGLRRHSFARPQRWGG